MRPSKETKFGYGFLLAGCGLPYLIDKLLGSTWAISVALVCTVLGVTLLISAHCHKDSPPPAWRTIIAGVIMIVVIVVSIGVIAKRKPVASEIVLTVQQEDKHVAQPVPSAPAKFEPPQSAAPKPPSPRVQASLEFTHTAIVKFIPDNSPFIPDSPAEIHVVYANTKGGIAREVLANCAALIFSGSIGNAHLVDAETEKWNEFKAGWTTNIAGGLPTDNDIAGHDVTHFCLAQTRNLKQDEVQRLRDEIDVIYVFGAVKWRDGTGQYESQVCTFFLPKAKTLDPKAPAQWRACITGHNVTRRPFKPLAN